MSNKALECGLAKNTASAQLWLDQCDAVSEVVELNDEWLEFTFDPTVEVFAVPDHIVWFDQGAAPSEGLEALNAFHNEDDDVESEDHTSISISKDGVWAGCGKLRDGVIEDCGAQFCDDNDQSLAIYDKIESAIAAGRSSIKVEIDGVTSVITWAIV